MDQRMNGYDGYHSPYQDGGFGYDEQQEYYMDNQGVYHHQQWNNNYQDPYSSSSPYQEPYSSSSPYQEPYSFSSQYQEPSSSSTQWQDSDTISKLKELLEEEKLIKAKYEEMIERMEKFEEQREEDEGVLSVVDEMIESPIDEEIDKEEHLATHEVETRIVEEVAKGDSNESTPKTLEMEEFVLPKVKESLQALLESDDLGEFHSKVGYLKFILDNKEMVEEALQEYEEELKAPNRRRLPIDTSTASLGTMLIEETSVKKEEPIRMNDVLKVEHVVKTTKSG